VVTVRIEGGGVGDLNAHRNAIPIDHPDGSVTRSKLELPVPPVSFSYMAVKDALDVGWYWDDAHPLVFYNTVVVDSAIYVLHADSYGPRPVVRWQGSAKILNKNWYEAWINSVATTSDFMIRRSVNGYISVLAGEAVDLAGGSTYPVLFSVSGSSLKAVRYRSNGTVATINATDTTFVSGYTGYVHNTYGAATLDYVMGISPPLTPVPVAQAIMEFDVEGSGKMDDPYRPSMSKNLVEVNSLIGLPDFLYREAEKYQVLKNKSFTDEEMMLLLGYVPKYQIDINAVTWGVFEFNPESPTVVIAVAGDNPYKEGAVERQKAVAERWWRPPGDYREAVELYNQLRRDHPYWLAGKDNFIYQMLGLEIFEWFQNVDFYYGELIEHRTHYDQLRQVGDEEIRRRLNELIEKLSNAAGLGDERKKHIAKAKEVLKRGW
jgi:hypothetical protein